MNTASGKATLRTYDIGTPARSARAQEVLALVLERQSALVDSLQAVVRKTGCEQAFEPVVWVRDEGRHGGGVRMVASPPVDSSRALFDRASANVSQVHYDDLPKKRLSSATALSCILHPAAPHAPSMHMHISWTEMRKGRAYWRVMADLNPAIPDVSQTTAFKDALAAAAGELYGDASAQGDRYFWIPALSRHRGVAHFYLEGHVTDDPVADQALAVGVVEAATTCYGELLEAGTVRAVGLPEKERADAGAAQLAYHTAYLFQVLTLDRGTTSGLLVHDQNDVGILGSLPSRVDTRLLRGWRPSMPIPQEALLDAIVESLEHGHAAPGIVAVTDDAKARIAPLLRTHYRQFPEALSLQASGDSLPPTVANHR